VGETHRARAVRRSSRPSTRASRASSTSSSPLRPPAPVHRNPIATTTISVESGQEASTHMIPIVATCHEGLPRALETCPTKSPEETRREAKCQKSSHFLPLFRPPEQGIFASKLKSPLGLRTDSPPSHQWEGRSTAYREGDPPRRTTEPLNGFSARHSLNPKLGRLPTRPQSLQRRPSISGDLLRAFEPSKLQHAGGANFQIRLRRGSARQDDESGMGLTGHLLGLALIACLSRLWRFASGSLLGAVLGS
jgi:hypothetical protein